MQGTCSAVSLVLWKVSVVEMKGRSLWRCVITTSFTVRTHRTRQLLEALECTMPLTGLLCTAPEFEAFAFLRPCGPFSLLSSLLYHLTKTEVLLGIFLKGAGLLHATQHWS